MQIIKILLIAQAYFYNIAMAHGRFLLNAGTNTKKIARTLDSTERVQNAARI